MQRTLFGTTGSGIDTIKGHHSKGVVPYWKVKTAGKMSLLAQLPDGIAHLQEVLEMIGAVLLEARPSLVVFWIEKFHTINK